MRLGGDLVAAVVGGRRDSLHHRFHSHSALCWRKDLRAFVAQPRLSVAALLVLRRVGLGGGPEACGRGNILRQAGDCISRSGVGLRRRANYSSGHDRYLLQQVEPFPLRRGRHGEILVGKTVNNNVARLVW